MGREIVIGEEEMGTGKGIVRREDAAHSRIPMTLGSVLWNTRLSIL